ncbi:MAG TPA: MoxR family ATPase [Planctomycetota bacterium]|nr:AAA family ATPase [Planctomycetota bacterium]OQC19256.1 MAG: ATPase family associated with various cellular activities (AAA) [Planctomycetes bacterium ADurb.Bin069]NMD34364.1 AAA domain-containing protein [Planctomycetota bacterium]HNS00293.1 MoxR family ATPase [Planctomycetota bacterium]HNU27321.1 MoxR family ATPase [Planctomycetota bacterium]
MEADITRAKERIAEQSKSVRSLKQEVAKVIVGQDYMVDRILVGLLTNGHILLEGVPGLAKTTAVKCVADAIAVKFQRLQFTPDLLPADLIGTQIYNPKDAAFAVRKGPIFANIILADEINRAPAKVQSALLEAMQERQVTIGEETFALPAPFLVMATQNPIEQEGTYPLPEAQVDRFMLKLKITYPTKAEEKTIMQRIASGHVEKIAAVMTPADLEALRGLVNEVYIDDKVQDYIVDIVFASRSPKDYKLDGLAPLIEYGASPRASIYLNLAARAHALLQGRAYATPQDVKTIGPDILRHRVIVSYEAEAEELTSDDIVKRIFDGVKVP